MKDLFETPEKLPAQVQAILNSFDESKDGYKECTRLENELKPLGYTFEWYLDAVPYNLRKIKTK